MATGVGRGVVPAKHDAQARIDKVVPVHKTELIGELAHTMANQLNNLMMAITGYAELELKKASTKERRSLEQVLQQATHATFLIHKLLDLSRARPRSLQHVELDAAIGEVGEFLKEILAERAEFILRLDAKSATIYIDRVELEQALFSLVMLARNVSTTGNKLTVSTSILHLDQSFIGTDSAEPGEYAVLAFDTHANSPDQPSCGQSDSANMFLASVMDIVKESKGLVRFSKEPRLTNSLKLYFPASIRQATAQGDTPLPRNVPLATTILVVEDDDAVRVPAVEFLMMEGFKVLQARTGKEALNVAQQSRSSLDVLVTDIFMPKMNGHEVAAALLEEHPHLKVLYMSGDPGSTGSVGAVSISPGEALRKPFRLNVLRDKIHDLLGE